MLNLKRIVVSVRQVSVANEPAVGADHRCATTFATIVIAPILAASSANSLVHVLAAPSLDVAQDRPDAVTTNPINKNAPVRYPITTAM